MEEATTKQEAIMLKLEVPAKKVPEAAVLEVKEVKCPVSEAMLLAHPAMKTPFLDFQREHASNNELLDEILDLMKGQFYTPDQVEMRMRAYESHLNIIVRKFAFIMRTRIACFVSPPDLFVNEMTNMVKENLYKYKPPFSNREFSLSTKEYLRLRLLIHAVIHSLENACQSFESCRFAEGIAYCELAYELLFEYCREKEETEYTTKKYLRYIVSLYCALYGYYMYLHQHPSDCACIVSYTAVCNRYKQRVETIALLYEQTRVVAGQKPGSPDDLPEFEAQQYVFNLDDFVQDLVNQTRFLAVDDHYRWCYAWATIMRHKRNLRRLEKIESFGSSLPGFPERISNSSSNLLESLEFLRIEDELSWLHALQMEYLRVQAVISKFGDDCDRRLVARLCEENAFFLPSLPEAMELMDYININGDSSYKKKEAIPLLLEPDLTYLPAKFALRFENPNPPGNDPANLHHSTRRLHAAEIMLFMYFKDTFFRLAKKEKLRREERLLQMKYKFIDEYGHKFFEDKLVLDHCLNLMVESLEYADSGLDKNGCPTASAGRILEERCLRILFLVNLLEMHLEGTIQRPLGDSQAEEDIDAILRSLGEPETGATAKHGRKKSGSRKAKSPKEKKESPRTIQEESATVEEKSEEIPAEKKDYTDRKKELPPLLHPVWLNGHRFKLVRKDSPEGETGCLVSLKKIPVSSKEYRKTKGDEDMCVKNILLKGMKIKKLFEDPSDDSFMRLSHYNLQTRTEKSFTEKLDAKRKLGDADIGITKSFAELTPPGKSSTKEGTPGKSSKKRSTPDRSGKKKGPADTLNARDFFYDAPVENISDFMKVSYNVWYSEADKLLNMYPWTWIQPAPVSDCHKNIPGVLKEELENLKKLLEAYDKRSSKGPSIANVEHVKAALEIITASMKTADVSMEGVVGMMRKVHSVLGITQIRTSSLKFKELKL